MFSLWALGMMVSLGYLYYVLNNKEDIKKPVKKLGPVITPDDLNKEPKALRNKMDKVWLKLDSLDHPEYGMDLAIDHKKEINNGMDEYINNMRPFINIARNDLEMPKETFAHIGYYLQGDLYDLDGAHLYGSARWVDDLNKHLPFPKKKTWLAKVTISGVLKALIALALVLALVGKVRAEETQVLHKGDVAPFTGILISESASKDIKKDLLELDALKFQKNIFIQNQTALEEQRDMWKNQANNLADQLITEKNSFWGRASYFLAGAGITVVLAFATNKATK